MNQWPLQRDCVSFYGDPYSSGWYAANVVHVNCPWPIFIGGQRVPYISIHKRCSDSLSRVLNNVWDALDHSIDKIKGLRYDRYDGSYNLRPKRGGTSPSMHSFACAIDWDAADNQFHSIRHIFTDQSVLVVKFKEEGWIWGGDWSPGSVDAMHVQAARIHD